MADLVVIVAQCAACISVLVVSHPSQLDLSLSRSRTDGKLLLAFNILCQRLECFKESDVS